MLNFDARSYRAPDVVHVCGSGWSISTFIRRLPKSSFFQHRANDKSCHIAWQVKNKSAWVYRWSVAFNRQPYLDLGMNKDDVIFRFGMRQKGRDEDASHLDSTSLSTRLFVSILPYWCQRHRQSCAEVASKLLPLHTPVQ